MNTFIPATKARKQFFKLINGVVNTPGSSISITVDGEPKIVMMSIEDFEGWQETLEIMSDKKLMKEIKKRLKNLAKEKTYSTEEVKKILNIA